MVKVKTDISPLKDRDTIKREYLTKVFQNRAEISRNSAMNTIGQKKSSLDDLSYTNK